MILDKENRFADNLDVKGARTACTAIDHLLAGSASEDSALTLVINVTAAFTRAAGAVDTVFSLQTYTSDSFGSDRTVLWSSGVIAKAALVAGYTIKVKVPYGALRFLNLVVVNTNAADAANIDAQLVVNAEHR